MYVQTTNGIKISVETYYQTDHSQPLQNQYVFAYRVSIENNSPQTIQLLSRHWKIVDSNGIKREIQGEGVIGEQPVIQPNAIHQYVSWCNLKTEIGKMFGTYKMQNTENGDLFRVGIPEFHMIAQEKLN